ncbi:hypothetical protein [Bacillus sp. FJAT-49736]|uniref:hypothetical protein n=1 Tax=Bacillus sp. FJAT-49736 TaxID=2833582 RepID=UPI001BCA3A07|nr:hypothetical protein [Bacillus sp. FJAT-49736]MBS4174817.1 hypothetical protein [Bacillus sp. FJAT-49736]MBS4175526.1 hypothetical protein [Bacillus sp. FJAT-49736]
MTMALFVCIYGIFVITVGSFQLAFGVLCGFKVIGIDLTLFSSIGRDVSTEIRMINFHFGSLTAPPYNGVLTDVHNQLS